MDDSQFNPQVEGLFKKDHSKPLIKATVSNSNKKIIKRSNSMEFYDKEIRTIKDLKEIIKNIPDDTKIFIASDIQDTDVNKKYTKLNKIYAVANLEEDKQVILFSNFFDLTVL